jgi:hypothetical protein
MITQTISEGIDYELIPCEDVGNDQAWDVRLMSGNFVESVIRFGNIKFNEETDCLNFSFLVVSTPDSELTEENVELQTHAGDVLQSVLEDAITNNALLTKEQDED